MSSVPSEALLVDTPGLNAGAAIFSPAEMSTVTTLYRAVARSNDAQGLKQNYRQLSSKQLTTSCVGKIGIQHEWHNTEQLLRSFATWFSIILIIMMLRCSKARQRPACSS